MRLLDTLLGHAGETPVDRLEEEFAPLLAPGEHLQRAFAMVRDLVVFTDRRLILVNKQGVTAKKVEYRSIPYRAINMFSLETAGHFELETDLQLWVNGQPGPLQLHLERGDHAARIMAILAQNTAK